MRDERIELVDEFTGRVMDDRRWPDGLQAALEAKETLPIRPGAHPGFDHFAAFSQALPPAQRLWPPPRGQRPKSWKLSTASAWSPSRRTALASAKTCQT